MKLNKSIFWMMLLTLPFLFIISGCNKFLDRKPLTATLDDLNQGGLESQIFGLYSFFRTSYGTVSSLPHLALHGFRSDDAVKGSEQSDGAEWVAPMDNFAYDKSFGGANSYWEDHYKLINFANTALQTADSLKLASPSDQVNLAEARFFRAYAYFDLVRTFGEVPKIDFRIYEASQANVPKKPIAEIYALIDEDLQFAEANLPASWGTKFIGRLTSGAAKTLHAQTFIFRQNWAQTLGLCQQVIGSGQYALYSPYWKIFKDEGENCSESIFEVQSEVTASEDNGSIYAVTQNVRQTTASGWNLGWGWNTPTQALVDAYEPGDPRKSATILFAGQSDDATSGGYGRTLPKFVSDGGILFSRYYNKKVYADPAKRAALNHLDNPDWINQRLLRYADVILMAAEAANEIGGTANAKIAEDYLEMIRARARGGDANVLPHIAFVNQAQMRAAIKKERRVEFGMEDSRFFDLVRWGDAVSVLGQFGYQDKNKYYPIPQIQIDKSAGVLVQNPAYQ
ncbi:MAG TPA: RagB/SusD family nutrient uptake outer membrane protein [Chitinophagaceae bacterium]|jgi:SusD family.